MSLFDRLGLALLAGPAIALVFLAGYLINAAPAWFLLYRVFSRRIEPRRIADNDPSPAQIRQEILASLRTVGVYGAASFVMVFALLSGWTRMYFRIADYGWGWFFASIAISIVVQDTYFYWTHRLMHHPRLFRLVHRTHHLSRHPTPWAAYSKDFAEAWVDAGIAPIILFSIPVHPLAFTAHMGWQISFNVLGHCGYELFPRWFLRSWWGNIMNTTTHHALHHEAYGVNYSFYFNFWDRLMGTNHRHYEERFTEQTNPTTPPEMAPGNG
jgi:sterol desaturase/sphingolipid hydroxylase (fatty acid hydroxylase superfamily)